MDIKAEALAFLGRRAERVFTEDAVSVIAQKQGTLKSGGSIGRLIVTALARAAMEGDIKSAQLLMELAGEDVKSRENFEKRQLDREKLGIGREIPVLVDIGDD